MLQLLFYLITIKNLQQIVAYVLIQSLINVFTKLYKFLSSSLNVKQNQSYLCIFNWELA